MKLTKILTDREKQFLIDSGIYEIFMESVDPARLLSHEFYSFIDNCIHWVDTPQGFGYWYELDKAWENIRETI